MTFEELCDALIRPTFEKLKTDYEERYPAARCEIQHQGSTYSLYVEYPANDKGLLGWHWTISFVPVEGDKELTEIFVSAWSDGDAFLLPKSMGSKHLKDIRPATIIAFAVELDRQGKRVIAEHKRRWPDTYEGL